ncbi:MAG: BON domain-containing protein [Oryzomonas sp.]|jgi:osmotically-inducible protein OsmY
MKAGYSAVMIAAAFVLLVTSVSVYASQTDDRIVSSARDSYIFKTYLKDDDITIRSKDGAVTLTGFVTEESHKTFATDIVTDLPGVISVDNRLVVKDAVPTANSDALLRDKVKSALMFHRSVNAENTKVDVKDGIVTLRGTATSQAQKDLTTAYARDVNGVNDVNNEMTVSKIGDNSLPTAIAEKIDDASISAQVNMALLFHRSTSFLHTTVETNHGVVTIGGKARNEAEADLVTKLVSDIHGVKNVINRMTIE